MKCKLLYVAGAHPSEPSQRPANRTLGRPAPLTSLVQHATLSAAPPLSCRLSWSVCWTSLIFTSALSCRSQASGAQAFYLPGVAPKEYQDGDRVDIRVHKLSSPKTHLPYDYYSLPFCEPAEGKIRVAENLGEVLHGAVIQNSPYEILMGKSEFKAVSYTHLTLPTILLV